MLSWPLWPLVVLYCSCTAIDSTLWHIGVNELIVSNVSSSLMFYLTWVHKAGGAFPNHANDSIRMTFNYTNRLQQIYVCEDTNTRMSSCRQTFYLNANDCSKLQAICFSSLMGANTKFRMVFDADDLCTLSPPPFLNTTYKRDVSQGFSFKVHISSGCRGVLPRNFFVTRRKQARLFTSGWPASCACWYCCVLHCALQKRQISTKDINICQT